METMKILIIATVLATALGPVSAYAGPRQLRLANASQAECTREKIEKANIKLWDAINDQNIYGVTQALMGGADVNQDDNGGNTPLLMACFKGHSAIVEQLLNSGAHVDKSDQYSNTPLKFACRKGHTGIVKRLAFHGATLTPFGQESTAMRAISGSHRAIIEQAREARHLVDDCCLTPRDVQIFAPHCTPLVELSDAIRGYADPLGGVQDPELRKLMQKQIVKNRQERFAQERAAALCNKKEQLSKKKEKMAKCKSKIGTR
ncbi:MAG: ankyrin repeat domain-containing protein [Candidatus Dependentiae bacterium]|nr:ankyrin repeat domain-containing protein [Candidatus Dependentiae bacterium]